MFQHILNFLKEENTLIIPGIGALTMVNRSTNELMFMPFLKHNDGALEKKVAESEGVDIELAKEKVTAFTQEISSQLQQGNNFVIEGLGVLSKDSSGEIVFSNNTNAVSKIEINTKQAEVEKTIENKVEESTIEQVKSNQIEEKKEMLSTVEEKNKNNIIENKVVEPVQTTKEESAEKVATEEEQWNDDLDLPPINYKPEKPKKPILEKAKKDKKPIRVGRIIFILILLFLCGGTTFLVINFEEYKDKIPFLGAAQNEFNDVAENKGEIASEEEIQNKKNDVVEFENKETTKTEEQEQIEESKEIPTNNIVVPQGGGLIVDKKMPIQVIAGSFAEDFNAEKFVKKMKDLGFPAQIIGVYDYFHTISVASFQSMDEFRANKNKFDVLETYWIKR